MDFAERFDGDVDVGTSGSRRHSAALAEQRGIAGQIQRPSGVVGDALGDGLPSRAVPVDVAVLQLQSGARRRLGDEADLDLAGVVRLGLDLPLRADVPAEHHTVWWFVDENACPPALASIDAPVIDVAANPRLEGGLGDRRSEQIVLWRFEVAEPLGKYAEGPLDRRLNDDLRADHGGLCLGHDLSSVGCSTASL